MITKQQPPALGIFVVLAATLLPIATAHAKRPADTGVINTAMVAGDPMSPVNPFNSGTDPLTMPGDARIGVFPYSRDQIFRVLTAPLKLTTIELERGEKLIADPAMGDSVQWEIDDDKMNHVFIKPHKADLVNTLHLTTNRREYDFTLIASPSGGFFYQTVRFQYPRAPMARVNVRDEASGTGAGAGERGGDSGSISVSPDKLNWDYSVDGSAEFKPEVVFDDGHSIWMRMPVKAQTWPVPMYKDHGDRVVGSFIRRGDFLVFQRLADEIVLVSGKDEVTVTREDIYDSLRGDCLMIPKGAFINGAYSADIKVGQERLLVASTSLRLPNGKNVPMNGMQGADENGYAGFSGDVNNHFLKIFGAGFITAILLKTFDNGATTSTTASPIGVTTTGSTAGQVAATTAQAVLQRNQNIQPTITVPPGQKFLVQVTQDIVMEPYHD